MGLGLGLGAGAGLGSGSGLGLGLGLRLGLMLGLGLGLGEEVRAVALPIMSSLGIFIAAPMTSKTCAWARVGVRVSCGGCRTTGPVCMR